MVMTMTMTMLPLTLLGLRLLTAAFVILLPTSALLRSAALGLVRKTNRGIT